MRRGKPKNIQEYIEIRTKQLEEDRDRCKVPYDKQWYNRIISELRWAASPHHNCFIKTEKSETL